MNPTDQKYRNVKTTNNAIKSKLMNLKHIDRLLTQLGYTLNNGEIYVVSDDQLANFIEGTPAIDYRRRLITSKLES